MEEVAAVLGDGVVIRESFMERSHVRRVVYTKVSASPPFSHPLIPLDQLLGVLPEIVFY